MPTPTTSLQLATHRRDIAKQNVATAQQRLAKAQADIPIKSLALATANTAVAAFKSEADDIRKRLSLVPTREDGEALLRDLEQVIIHSRAAQAAIVRADGELKSAQAEALNAQAAVAASTSRLSAAESNRAPTTEADKQRTGRKDAMAQPPLATIKADAAAALTAAPWNDAKKRIEEDIPPTLLARARERRNNETNRIAKTQMEALAAEDAALSEGEANGGLDGKAKRQWALFLRAEAALRDFVATAKAHFDQATKQTAQVADTANAPLTTEQKDRIHDPAQQAARDTAITAEEVRDTAWNALTDAKAALRAELLKAAAAGSNPDDVQTVKDAKDAVASAAEKFEDAEDLWRAEEKARDEQLAVVKEKQALLDKVIQAAIANKKDPKTDADVTAAQAALEAAENDLKDAEEDYQESNHGVLHAWEAAVPDTTWQLLEGFEQAKAIFSGLKNSDPAALKTALDSAEKDYVAARLKADASGNILEQLAAEQTTGAVRQQLANEAASQRRFGALRGDN